MAGLTVRSYSCGRRFASSFFRFSPYGWTLLFGYGCRYQLRRILFTAIAHVHAVHTRGGSRTALA